MASSLGQLDRLARHENPREFDVWGSVSLGRYSSGAADGLFTLTAVGADCPVNRNLLIGGFVQATALAPRTSMERIG